MVGLKEKPERPSRKTKSEKKGKEPPKIEQVIFGENGYTGIIRTVLPLGPRYFDGMGKYTWKGGAVTYDGPFVRSTIQGIGKFSWDNGNVLYEGSVQRGQRHGYGVLIAKGVDARAPAAKDEEQETRVDVRAPAAKDEEQETKYEGQWQLGLRHGQGKLSYPSGSFYEGEWESDRKHGAGTQNWAGPNGCVYTGQWTLGHMSGHGSMVWRRNDEPCEEYIGQFANSKARGEGKHTWLSLPPKFPASYSVKATHAPQQMNNKYEGQWDDGLRHGEGTFYYANGSSYKGQWSENKKHGHGVYTYDDGSIFDGEFHLDRMIFRTVDDDVSEPKSTGVTSKTTTRGPPETKKALNIGGEDNPVRQCIDIDDLHCFARDVEGVRDAYNMLLRYLGELRHMYARYRSIMKSKDDDPFTMSMAQLWLLCRDCDLVSPSCPLARVNRYFLGGPRHEINPVKMTFTSRESRLHDYISIDDEDEDIEDIKQRRPHTREDVVHDDDKNEDDDDNDNEEEDDAELGANDNDDDSSPQPRQQSGGAGTAPDDGGGLSLPSGDNEIKSLYCRAEDAEDMQFTHAPHKYLLFRHFLEGIVRLALARYTHEECLETMMERVLKDHILSNLNRFCVSEEIFAFLVDEAILEVFKRHHAVLWSIYKRFACGTGLWGPDTGLQRGANFNGPSHRSHINGRMDYTIRIKSVLQLLTELQFIRPEALTVNPGQVFQSELFETPEDMIAGLAGLLAGDDDAKQIVSVGLLGSEAMNAAMDGFGGGPGGLDSLVDGTKVPIPTPLQIVDPGKKADILPEKIACSEADVVYADFRVTVMEVLKIFSDTLSPWSLDKIRGVLTEKDDVTQCFSLTEYSDSEVIFAEFQRFLLVMSDKVEACEKCGEKLKSLTSAQRLDGFLTYVFLPALTKGSYPGPKIDPKEPSEPDQVVASGDDAASSKAAEGAAESAEPAADVADAKAGEEQQDAPAEDEKTPEEPVPPSLWYEPRTVHEPYIRQIPTHYDAEVEAW
eukprot:GEMP01009538.1.p1 GENE.GEMP01009538.1~~GEMP01009538.1.p1  ORF type:complete len:1005 (+),score=261.73 GEMP01009538.1:25-3039(+)